MIVYNEKNGDIVLSSKHVFSVQSNVEKQKKIGGKLRVQAEYSLGNDDILSIVRG